MWIIIYSQKMTKKKKTLGIMLIEQFLHLVAHSAEKWATLCLFLCVVNWNVCNGVISCIGGFSSDYNIMTPLSHLPKHTHPHIHIHTHKHSHTHAQSQSDYFKYWYSKGQTFFLKILCHYLQFKTTILQYNTLQADHSEHLVFHLSNFKIAGFSNSEPESWDGIVMWYKLC